MSTDLTKQNITTTTTTPPPPPPIIPQTCCVSKKELYPILPGFPSRLVALKWRVSVDAAACASPTATRITMPRYAMPHILALVAQLRATIKCSLRVVVTKRSTGRTLTSAWSECDDSVSAGAAVIPFAQPALEPEHDDLRVVKHATGHELHFRLTPTHELQTLVLESQEPLAAHCPFLLEFEGASLVQVDAPCDAELDAELRAGGMPAALQVHVSSK